MNLKSMILATALTLGVAVPSVAATLGNVEVVVGGPTITDTGIVSYLPGVGGTAGGLGAGIGSTTTDPLLLTADFSGLTNIFTAQSFGPTSPGNYLAGNFMDAADENGKISVLYGTSGGSAATSFGALFLMTISDGLIADGALSLGQPPLTLTSASITIQAVEEIATNVIPLPASLPLLLAGFGGLALIRTRKNNC